MAFIKPSGVDLVLTGEYDGSSIIDKQPAAIASGDRGIRDGCAVLQPDRAGERADFQRARAADPEIIGARVDCLVRCVERDISQRVRAGERQVALGGDRSAVGSAAGNARGDILS